MTTPTVVQSTIGDGFTLQASVGPAFTLAQTAGNCNLIFIAGDSTSVATIFSVKDTANNMYTYVNGLAPTGTNCGIAIYQCASIVHSNAGINGITITWNAGVLSFPEVYTLEITGADAVTPIDAATIAFLVGNGSSASAGPVTTGSANELIIGYCFTNTSCNVSQPGWVLDSKSITGYGSCLMTKTAVLSGSSVTATTALGGSDIWVQMVIGVQPTLPVVVINHFMGSGGVRKMG
jgi:hypothetical protein